METKKHRVVVIGAANLDIAGKVSGEIVPRDSNLGTIRLGMGGVGRNIAHNLALLGCDVHLIAPFGDDGAAQTLLRGCLDAGIDLSSAFTVPGGATSSYLYLMDSDGEMQVAVNDMSIVESLDVEHLEERRHVIETAEACVIDANLSEETLGWIAENVGCPLFCDPISCVKAPRIRPILGRLHALKPNRMEAEELTGIAIDDDESLMRAADALIATGLERAFVSLGKRGLLCASRDERFLLERTTHQAINSTGAGDSMMAALVWAHLEGLSLEDAGWAGLASSSINVESPETVNPALGADALRNRIEEMRG